MRQLMIEHNDQNSVENLEVPKVETTIPKVDVQFNRIITLWKKLAKCRIRIGQYLCGIPHGNYLSTPKVLKRMSLHLSSRRHGIPLYSNPNECILF
jgi:hypothetical protein